MNPLRVGTRASPLALRQAGWVKDRLAAAGIPATLVEIRTAGDDRPEAPLASFGGRGIFTRQLDEALLDGRVDLAVHSLKDIPTALPSGVAIAAVGPRADPSDALVARGPLRWNDLPRGATVATGSIRRRAQLLHARPDLTIVDLRGNVETRLAKLDRNPAWTAIVIAAAGLERLGLNARLGERLSPEVMLPAPGQGAIAVTVHEDRADLRDQVCRAAHDASTSRCVSAERAFLDVLEEGCQVPIAALAGEQAGAGLTLVGRVLSPAGDACLDGDIRGRPADPDAAAELGRAQARPLLGRGAGDILRAARGTEP